MPIVRIKSGESAGASFELGDAPLVVGRDDRAEIQILDQGVSRRHAEFYRIGEMYFIRDLESRNGTFVNEERVSEELLRDNDEVRIASTVLMFDGGLGAANASASRRRSRVRTGPNADATTTIQIDENLARNLDDLAEPTKHQESQDLASIYQCSELIAEARDTRQLLERVAKLACEAMSAEHACIFVRRESSREFELEASYQPEGDLRQPPIISTRVIVEVVQTKRAVLNSDERAAPASSPLTAARPASVIGAPLVWHDQVHGVLYCASTDPDRFGSDSLELAISMGIQTGVALQGLILQQRQERMLISAVRTLGSLLEMRDPLYTGHSGRVASYCSLMAQALKIPKAEARRIQLAALLHNVAKIVIPPDMPDDETCADVIRHRNQLSEKLIGKMEGLDFVLPVITTYHEHMDGSGLPDGLMGEKIPLAARILAVADRVDTLLVRGERPAFEPYELDDAVADIQARTPTHYDPRVVEGLVAAHEAGALEALLPDAPPPTQG